MVQLQELVIPLQCLAESNQEVNTSSIVRVQLEQRWKPAPVLTLILPDLTTVNSRANWKRLLPVDEMLAELRIAMVSRSSGADKPALAAVLADPAGVAGRAGTDG